MLISRWNPVCPECGYPLRGLSAPRCPECGIQFPTDSRTFRRWAFRRIPWDRAGRSPIIAAYLKTIALILFLPWRAARGLALPDHRSRCVRWVIVHLVIVAFACTLLANGRQFPHWLVAQIWPPAFDPPHMFMFSDAPAGRVIVWFLQSFAAWSTVTIVPIALASYLSLAVPGRHRAAKLGGVKWSLYLACLYVPLLVGWYGYYTLNPLQAQATTPVRFTYPLPTPELPVVLLAGAYGLWWAAGIAANPYNRARTPIALFAYGLVYAAACSLLAYVLFPAGALDALL